MTTLEAIGNVLERDSRTSGRWWWKVSLERSQLMNRQSSGLSRWDQLPVIRVLVVDDDGDLKETIRDALFMEGMEVDTASSGDSALDLTPQFSYDVVLTDIRMPGTDGIEFAKRLRKLGRPPGIILMTAYPQWSVQERAWSAGINCIVEKPLNLFDLASLVRRTATHPPGEWVA